MFKINPVKQAFDDDMFGYGISDYITSEPVKSQISYTDEKTLKTFLINLLESYFIFSQNLLDTINNPTVISFYDGMHQDIDKIILKVKSFSNNQISISTEITKLIDETEKISLHPGVTPFASLNISKSIDYLEFMLQKEKDIKRELCIK